LGPCKLMIVDDEKAIRDVLSELIEVCLPDFKVVAEASNGLEAVARAQEVDPDVIIMDVRMPLMDGIQATRRIKQELGLRAVVVTSTSFSWSEIKESAFYAGADLHIQKPFDFERMESVLREAWSIANAAVERVISV